MRNVDAKFADGAFDLLTFIMVVRVMYAVGYLCANFDLPRPLCSLVRPDVR